MKLQILKEKLNRYVDTWKNRKQIEDLYWFEIPTNWQNNWDLESGDFVSMLDKVITSEISRKLWKDEKGDAKHRLLDLIKLDPEFGRNMFRELINQEIGLEKRISHFKFGMDVLLEEYKKQNRTSIVTTHFHEDARLPLLYLYFHYPAEYVPYFHDSFQSLMSGINAYPTYNEVDIERYYKAMKTFWHYLGQEEALIKKLERLLPTVYKGLSTRGYLLQDFYRRSR